MRYFLLFIILVVVGVITALPTSTGNAEKGTNLLEVADAGDLHSNDGVREARHWGGGWGGWGGGWGGRWGGWGGGWGGRWGGWGGGGWGGWGGRRWGGGWGGWGGGWG
ncbi:neuropeptide-like protein 32 [Lucilia sericata]|uniref:neuropeptide-like protein 32 n=1 Tax=Lucilia sericata TaxID=13632 RepID=UPI0018A81F22|nr:neuropeptide-like protein 32 [Lucilia sericata]